MPLAPGTALGPYQIVALVGAGGMGEVYRARDPRLERDVAVKVLPEPMIADPMRLHRFVQEARAIAALSHPHILAIFDVGTGDRPYLVTELLEGETLRETLDRGPLPLPRAIDVALQLIAGLDAAHGRGIVHRDLKPENVFLTRDHGVKILDFGLAKVAVAGLDIDLTRPGGSLPGMVVGTAGYMSPEQVRGLAADPRSDIFALGAILFEMVTGQRAFTGPSPADAMSAVLREEPADLTLRTGTLPSIARIVRRCVEKDPAHRFQTVGELRSAIETISDAHPAAATGPKAEEKSVAVLPFANMSSDPDNQFFSDGLAEELINALARLPGLKVASRTSAFRFRGNDVDIREIGRQLQVRTVLEGSVRRAGNRLRVTAQLVNISDGYHIWSERFDREMADVFEIQDEIVSAIVKALAPALAGEARIAVRRPTDNVEAYELYLRGRQSWHLRTPASLRAAKTFFERVIALDPEYALAYAGIADYYAITRVYGWFSGTKCRQPARDAVARAVALDSSLPEVHYSQGLVSYYFDQHWRGAEAHMRRALALNPRLAEVQAYLGLVLASDFRSDEAATAIQRARDLDPLSPLVFYLEAHAMNVLGRFDRAERAARQMLELQPDSLAALWPLAFALAGQGRPDEAVVTAERVVHLSRAPIYVGVLGHAYALAGRQSDARRLLVELEERAERGEYVLPAARVILGVGLNDTELVRAGLQACIEDETPPLSVQVGVATPLQQMRKTDSEIDRLLNAIYDGPPSGWTPNRPVSEHRGK